MSDETTGIEPGWAVRRLLDAACFHLYGVARPDVEYVLGIFAGLADDEDGGPSDVTSTARLVPEIHDAMQTAIETGAPYKSLLDPPPTTLACVTLLGSQSDVLGDESLQLSARFAHRAIRGGE